MCRFTLYLGPSAPLSSFLFEADHSLIHQSAHSAERGDPLNGDGFGVGWYKPEVSAEPAVFRSTTPAWNNRNLASLSKVVTSPCVLAHVRAATNLSGVNEANCHPFRFGQLLFMHNGDVGEFRGVRRALLDSVCDAAFDNVYGSTDSEHVFALVIDELERTQSGSGAARLAQALESAIARVLKAQRQVGSSAEVFLNLAISDGTSAAVTRFAANTDEPPESLYMYRGVAPRSLGTSATEPVLMVSSERLTADAAWAPIPANHVVELERGQAPLLRAIKPNVASSQAA